MPLTQQDQEYIKEVAANVSAEVADRIITKVMEWHVGACPHGKSILMAKWMLVGICLTSGLAGGGIGAILSKII